MSQKPQSKVALVAGASGIVGSKLVKTLLQNEWQIIGLSRSGGADRGTVPFVNVDLLNEKDTARALKPLRHVTHIFYSAWLNAASWREMVEPNVTMLRNLVTQVEKVAPLETVSLMQGYKIYGAHLGPFKTPARESDAAIPGAEFNTAQQDWLCRFQHHKTWHWHALRPGVVGSALTGNTMNLALSIAIYASLCKAQNLPLRFPGSQRTWHSIIDHTDDSLLSAATLWASTASSARNQAFNINNGDIWRWCELWPLIAGWFELETAPPVALSFQQLFGDYRRTWHALAEKKQLVEADIMRLSDGQFADFVFSWDYDMFGDGSKLRRAGFTEFCATDEMFIRLFTQFRMANIIP